MDVSWQKWSKNDYSLKLLGRPLLLPLHQLPVKLPPGDPAPEVHCFKVESCWGVKPNMPKQFSSAAAAMLVALSTNKYLSWKKKQEFVSLKNSLKARWCHWEDAHVIWCHLRIPLAWIQPWFKNLIVVDSDSRDKYTVPVQSPAS